MTQRIEVPGLGVVEFPANMTDEQISAAIKQNLAPQAPNQPPAEEGFGQKLGGLASEAGKVLGSSVYGGLTAIPRLVMEGGNALNAMYPTPGIPIPWYEELAGADTKIRETLKPETKAGKVVGNIGEAGVAALAGPGAFSAPLRLMGIGAASGAGSEVAQAAFGDGVMPSLVGGVLGGGLAGLASAAKTNRGALAQEALEGVRPDDLAEGLRRMEYARSQGLEGNIAQFMPEASNLDAYASALSGSRHGALTKQQLRDQPGAIAERTQELVSDLPGQHLPPRLMANEAQEAATLALETTRQRAGEAWRKLAPSNRETFPEEALQELDDALLAMAKASPNTHRGQMAEDVRSALKVGKADGPELLGPDGLPIDDIIWNDNVLNLKDSINQQLTTFGARKLNTPSAKAGDQKAAQDIRNLFKDVVEEYAPDLKAANEAYESMMGVYNSQRKSVTGDIAGRAGAQVDVNAPQGKLMAMFDSGTVPGAPSEILTFERDLRKAGQQEVFQNAAKTWIAERAQKAVSSPTPSSRAPDDVAVNLLKIFGDPRSLSGPSGQKAAQGFDDVLAGMARSQNVKEVPEYVRGFKNFMTIVTDLSNRPSSGTGLSRQQIQERAQAGLTRNLGQVSIMTPLRQPALAWARFLERDALSTIDKLMTSPEGVKVLVELGKTQPYSQKALTAFGTFLGTMAADKSVE